VEPLRVLTLLACAAVLAGCPYDPIRRAEESETYWTSSGEFGGGLGGPSSAEGMRAVDSAAQFEETVLKSDLPVLVEFYKPGCTGCILLAPVLASIQPEYEGRVRFVRLDATKPANYSVVRGSGVRVTPTCLVFVGGQEVARQVGDRSQGDMRRFIDAAVREESTS
jgi:thioredoxin 1